MSFPILLYVDSREPGGYERQLALLLPSLLERGVFVRLVCPPGRSRELLAAFSGEVSSPPRSLPGWRRLVAATRPRLAMATRGRIYALAAACRVEGVPSAWICGYPPEMLGSDAETRAASVLFDAILVPSRFMAERVRSYCGRSPVTLPCVPPPFVPPPLASKADRRRSLGLSDDSFLLGYASRFVPHKRQGDLVRLTSCLRDRGIPAELLLVGETPDARSRSVFRDLVRLARELRVEDRVRFLSATRGSVGAWLSLCDLIVSPAENEGLGVALLEGLSAGVPAVVASPGGAEEAVRLARCGSAFPCGDIGRLTGEVERLWKDRGLRARLGELATRAVARRFSVKRAERALWRLVSRLARGAAC